ncbi:TIGR00730 family Rossman fold protein [Cognatishimia activa]|uniref:LOG family protein n=1 Tax=Cognatishimia activa TaxID=1715691 RepID=UPI0022308DBC|nr:TIGR00730 family Rossman fold protein [Cognatishimia activa]UZD92463.1 TIGR00730 family Rossman fold protein [Cognatishimia activa]
MATASICVFCGSRAGVDPAYEQAALELGKAIADQNWRLVYGAGDIGLMGATARATQDAGGDTFGVIPTHLLKHEVGKTDLTSFIVTENMHERKKVMFMNCDAVVVLPGGAGSLDEFFEVLTWRQLGLHDKPIVLLNINGYWDPLVALIDHVIDQGFADASLKNFITVEDDTKSTVKTLKAAF